MNYRTLNIVTWTLTILLALWMIAAGLSKLAPSDQQLSNFETWDVSPSFMFFIGICEILGAIGMFIARLRPFATLGLSIILIGAIATHINSDELVMTPTPTIAFLMTLSVFLLWRKRRSMQQ
jgi:uncharacterized membrane protein YphA (DoxX/SURF4 family)